MALQALQNRALEQYKTDTDSSFAFDPAIIIVIAEIVVQLIIKLQEQCNQNPDEAANMAQSLTWLQRRIIRLETIRTMGRKAYRRNGREVGDAIIAAAATVSADEIRVAYAEVRDSE